ncbi:MAG TPA: 1-deoxy-D-xylulose-5-phosphate reductoisomerase [Deltaproteobacteria bacterium]|nr:1-deoxy-D-xylulose-5-phosphate reductoisomerase [Candidatus Binatota bacterium]HIL12156.1 1-deoxy-D-xylulose-5-phosphate reductoisomerase [Deltaproteobacteria bacterium]
MAAVEKKRVSILGSTGSIGTTALALIARFPDRFDVTALAAGRRVAEVKAQVEQFRPSLVSVADADDARELAEQLKGTSTRVTHGAAGLVEVATAPGTDVLLSALVGAVGLEPTLAAVDKGYTVALANKEVMVVAGELLCRRAAASGARVLPVDSEHNAIFLALQGHRRQDVRRLVLTASGGPFRGLPREKLVRVTREQALAHPNWDMGDKISIDSATMMNKGLEIIEARWLFDVEPSTIEVVVHPQSIVHSMVEYVDGSVVALMAIPDMSIPVACALSWPDLLDLDYLPRLDLARAGTLSFEAPDTKAFPCLDLAWRALALGGSMPAVVNAANEVAVARFLADDIAFLDIAALIGDVMAGHQPVSCDEIGPLLEADGEARERAGGWSAD